MQNSRTQVFGVLALTSALPWVVSGQHLVCVWWRLEAGLLLHAALSAVGDRQATVCSSPFAEPSGPLGSGTDHQPQNQE